MRSLLPAAALCLLVGCGPQSEAARGAPSTAAVPAPTPAPAPVPPGRVARYTRLDACRVVERAAPGDGDYSTSVCPGLAGYGFTLTEDDARQNLVVTLPRGGGAHNLRLAEATGSDGFSRLGDIVEWRGAAAPGAFRPDALIVRYFVSENPEHAERETAYLLIVSLAGARPCVTARLAPGPDQNARARERADAGGRCLA